MARQKKKPDKKPNGNGGNLGFEAKLWAAADKLRGHMDAAEYKHVVFGLAFLEYISDAFEKHRAKIAATSGADPEDSKGCAADNVFWVPKGAREVGDRVIAIVQPVEPARRRPGVNESCDEGDEPGASMAVQKATKLKGVQAAASPPYTSRIIKAGARPNPVAGFASPIRRWRSGIFLSDRA